jgi:Carboxypeptidase regulatory-like domain
MLSHRFRVISASLSLFFCALTMSAQDDTKNRGRKYKAPPETSHIEVTVLRDASGKPIPNAAVILRPSKDGHEIGSMELKTGPDGKASIDIIPTGSVVEIQVIATGFSTHGGQFDVASTTRNVTVRMLRPKAQVSTYETNGSGENRSAGVQEPTKHPNATAPKALAPSDPVIQLPSKPADDGATPPAPKQ